MPNLWKTNLSPFEVVMLDFKSNMLNKWWNAIIFDESNLEENYFMNNQKLITVQKNSFFWLSYSDWGGFRLFIWPFWPFLTSFEPNSRSSVRTLAQALIIFSWMVRVLTFFQNQNPPLLLCWVSFFQNFWLAWL